MADHPLAGEHHPSPASSAATALGPLLLLPSELLHEILLRLAVPELLRVRSVARPLSSLISSPDFRRLYHLSSASSGSGPAAAWLLLFKKLPPRDAAIRGFHGPSGRWFRIPVSAILAPAVPPGEDLYFLAASGSSFLFAANGRRELVVVDLTARAARRLPPSPLGPRGTSSWRRFGLKLVADPPGSNRFRYPSFSCDWFFPENLQAPLTSSIEFYSFTFTPPLLDYSSSRVLAAVDSAKATVNPQ